MADTFSTWLKARFIETGTDPNTWGAILNSDVCALFDAAITGVSVIALGSATTYSMPALTNGGTSTSRSLMLRFTGSPGSLVTVTLPASVTSKFYIIDNQCGQTITLKYSASTFTVDIATAKRQIVWADGSDVFPVFASASDATTLGGVASANFARRDAENIFTDRNSNPFVTVTEAPTTTVDASVGNHQVLTLTGNRTMAAPTNVTDGQELFLLVQQDATGNRTLTWNSVFVFENGAQPVLATTAASVDMFLMIYNAALAKWIVGRFGLISAAGGANYNFAITENTIDWNLLAKVGTPGGAVTVNVTINQGVILQATCTGSPALDLSGLPAGSTVNLFNSGYVLGKGGDGGVGDAFGSESLDQDQTSVTGSDGFPGGHSIVGPGAGNTFNVTNVNGHIWGGGGGGAGGKATTTVGSDTAAAGGGGGGGAGGGRGGPKIGTALGSGGTSSSPGTSGTTGPNGAGGTGGAGGSNGLTGYQGGNGGDFGTAGDADAGPSHTGGASGKAIELGGGAVTFVSGSGSPNIKGAVS